MNPRDGWRPAHRYQTTDQVFRVPPYDQERREHFWLMIVGYHVDPTNADTMAVLDQENLAVVTGPGCAYCELAYSPSTAVEACTGDV